MTDLPDRPNLLQLRRQAKDLLRAAKAGAPDAVARIGSVSERLKLDAAQLAIAREYGFSSWPRLKLEVDRRRILNNRDVDRLRVLLRAEPELAVANMEHWCDHRKGVRPLNYIAMLRFDSKRLGLPRHLPGTGAVARALLDAGAPVDGDPAEPETPLMTAASYGDAEVAQVLIEAGADLEAVAAVDAGGVPGRTALAHAAVFGMTDVLDALVTAGARLYRIEDAAAAGDLTGWLSEATPLEPRIRALVMAADHQRLDAIDLLVSSGTPIDAMDAEWGRQALCLAAQNGRVASVRRLLALGADPNARDGNDRSPLEYCRPEHRYLDSPAHDQVEAILRARGEVTLAAIQLVDRAPDPPQGPTL